MKLTDVEIEQLLTVPKTVINPRARKKLQNGSEQTNYDLICENGMSFRLYVRQNTRIPNGFSCGLYYITLAGESITLARYNGSDHAHSNPLEGTAPFFMACHIHRATQRYMEAGRKADHYAETTTRYSDLTGALKEILSDCKIDGLTQVDSPTPPIPIDEPQNKLF
ncbi:hypothetical protein HC248_01399 [Polaromonas vacuolata]|uniref:Uncharacterized protein n=1 Tax=Polaromonas vacuolata TaxID=37448 RepID=A0A6H2H8J5_9BURK|nr:hypothetical protein [Polaromonas vacuolata]QJC56113.1 hypothetical protein HC248_01399 [Polaromonas vacuolata]